MTELKIQSECFIWHNRTYPNKRGLLFSVPNGGKRHGAEAKNLKYSGVISGVSDMLLFEAGKCYCLEFKDEKGRQSENQKKWQENVVREGFDYYVVRSLGQFKEIVRGIYGG